MNNKKLKHIAISEKNYKRLVNYGSMNQTFDQLLDQILDIIVRYKRDTNDDQLTNLCDAKNNEIKLRNFHSRKTLNP